MVRSNFEFNSSHERLKYAALLSKDTLWFVVVVCCLFVCLLRFFSSGSAARASDCGTCLVTLPRVLIQRCTTRTTPTRKVYRSI